MSEWLDRREAWVAAATDEALLNVITIVAAGYDTDENLGDTTERFQTLLWLASRGRAGKEWGIAGAAVDEL